MPRFFDDYSNTYLTHDSSAGRKQQRRGWKFRENFRLHYEKHLEEWQSGPMGLAAAQQGFLRGRSPHEIPPLPPGWKEELDEATNIPFYTHQASGRRTWVRPGFRPPPAGGPPPPRGGPPFMPAGRPPPLNQPPPNLPPPNLPQPNLPPPNLPPPGMNQPPPGSGVPPPGFQQAPLPPNLNIPPPPGAYGQPPHFAGAPPPAQR